MKILAVTTKSPYPLNEGRALRTYNLLKQLARVHEVHLVSFVQSREELDGLKAMHEFCGLVEAEPLYLNFVPLRIALDALREPFSEAPLAVTKYATSGMRRRIKRLMDEHHYDILHLDMLHLGEYLPMGGRAITVIGQHNVESILLERRAERETRYLQGLYLRYQARKLARYEAAVCRRADRVIAVSEVDAGELAQMTGRQDIATIPNGVDTSFFEDDSDATVKPASLIFVGGFTWFPNLDGIEFFCEEILPRIAEKIPDVSLTVIGQNPDNAKTRAIAANPRVKVAGRVDDIRPYVAEAAAFIVPLRIGGGTRLKILDALSMGKAIVSTSIGCEGLAVEDGISILTGDSAQAFADSVVKVLQDPGLGRRLGEEGRQLVKSVYDWEVIGKRLGNIYKPPSFNN
jgi:polysaccharide biosynthesis protein PslH